MDRRTLLVVLGVGLAGCTGGESDSSPTSTPTDAETPADTVTSTDTSAEADTPTGTERPALPAIRDSSVTTAREFEGNAIPKGAPLTVDVTYDLWAYDGTAHGEVDIDVEPPGASQVDIDEEVELSGDGLLTGEYQTTIDTPGTAGMFSVMITMSDLIGERTTDPTEHLIKVAEYTRTEYGSVQETISDLESRIKEIVNKFEDVPGQSILNIAPGDSFDFTPVQGPADDIYHDANDALDKGVDPFEQELRRLRNIGQVIARTAVAQRAIMRGQDALVAFDMESLETELADATQQIDDLDDAYQPDRDYPTPVGEKIDKLRNERSKLADLTGVAEDLQFGAERLADAQSSLEAELYNQASTLALEAARVFRDVLDELEDVSLLPETVDEFSSIAEDGRDEAEDIREQAVEELR
ncbi:hypothetical protein [Halorubrum sp. SD683]|uniref:hypothetical protein n=1 Tax=Halorubrum sp. SD683 TaxID=1855873 RepID=UPI000A2E715E|nr:hypothetical protein [Halorubrum sp. SD683]OTF01860.1 hypothetical protein B9G49_01025 [Halorubrum sp. SD683]